MSGKRLPEEHQEAIRERLRLLLKDVFADQKQAAKALGIDQATISKAINGGAVGYGTLNAVANYLKVSTDEITGRSIERSSRVEPDEDVHSPAYESSYEIERYDALPQWPHYVAYVKRRVGARISDLMLLPLSCNGDPNVMRIFILAYNHTWTIRFRPRVRPHDVTRF